MKRRWVKDITGKCKQQDNLLWKRMAKIKALSLNKAPGTNVFTDEFYIIIKIMPMLFKLSQVVYNRNYRQFIL